MGLYHLGNVKCLMEQGVFPRVVSGSSAGSIVAAWIGTRTTEQVKPYYRNQYLIFFILIHVYGTAFFHVIAMGGDQGW